MLPAVGGQRAVGEGQAGVFRGGERRVGRDSEEEGLQLSALLPRSLAAAAPQSRASGLASVRLARCHFLKTVGLAVSPYH